MPFQNHPLISIWSNLGKDISPHLKASLEKLSTEHLSGISLEQLESPMMKQYRQAKDEAPDALLFFRMGDFYEMFGIDAILVSDICGLTLTSRDKNSESPVPMAGAPVSGYKNHLKKCVQAGFKVAICDQMEDPRQVKGIVKREITRIATPAVLGDLEDENPNVESHFGCYLACILGDKKLYTLSFVDVSTGEFKITTNLNDETLAQEIATLKPKEIMTSSYQIKNIQEILNTVSFKTTLNKIESWILRSEKNCHELFCEFFSSNELSSFGLTSIPHGLEVVVSLLFYLKSTQKNVLQNIKYIQQYDVRDFLVLDDSTKKHLDFFVTSTGEKKGSLFHFLNHCATHVGSRFLIQRLNYPFKDLSKIKECHDKVEKLIFNQNTLKELILNLRQVTDIDRLLSRAAQKSLDPQGMSRLGRTLHLLPILKQLWFTICEKEDEQFNLNMLSDMLNKALQENPAQMVGKGELIFKTGFHRELDELIELELNFKSKLDDLEKFERDRSQIPTLKIGYTRVFGYYFEISKGRLAQVPAHFLRKQTLTNGERFITQELKELEEKALTASERRVVLERELLEKLNQFILDFSKELSSASQFIGQIDLLCTFAQVSSEQGWSKPIMNEEKKTILKDSVHPILAFYHGQDFVPNDISLRSIHLITGPNMAGKSTLMRQVALAQVLSQMGLYVPASYAELGVVDRILTRIGSADHALKNQSTFMVEMLETANMLRLASEKSLLILDEIGRGTSTYDGVSIAWSILEHLHDKTKARTLFSTHYHELADACMSRKNILPMQMAVVEHEKLNDQGEISSEILFSRRYMMGSAGKSYGILVAKLAGLPQEIIHRAEILLKNLEENKREAQESLSISRKARKIRHVELPEQTLF